MILPISEIARRLDLNTVTVRRWIRQGRMPVVKEGDNGIFSHSDLVEWARQHKLSYAEPVSTDESRENSDRFILLSALKRGGIFKDIEGNGKEEILRKAVDLVPGISEARRETLFRQVTAREKMTSTGIGKGVAIPHPRNPLSEEIHQPLIITCFFSQGIDFDSIDKVPVFAMFLLLSSTTEEHLNILSRLSFLLRDSTFLAFLRHIPEAETFFKKVEAFEAQMEDQK